MRRARLLTPTLLAAAAAAPPVLASPHHPIPSEGPSYTLAAHEVILDNGGHLVDPVPGSPPSAALPEGTIFSRFSDAHYAHWQVGEIDVRRGHVLRSAPIHCTDIARDGAHLYGACGSDFVSFDASTMREEWRTPHGLCSSEPDDQPSTLEVFAGPGVVGIVAECSTIAAVVVDVQRRVASPVARTRILPVGMTFWADEMYFHGRTALVVYHGRRDFIALLSPDYRAVKKVVVLPQRAFTWDDGHNLHIYVDARDTEHDPRDDKPPPWIAEKTEFVLSDTLEPVKSGPLVQRQADTYETNILRGLRRYDMDVGTQHFWVTASCCGDEPGGVFTASTTGPKSPL
jgi:hypothetical protein